jgi:hypothetical protein
MFEGNKVNEADITTAIKESEFILLPDGRTTICMLTLDNGFTVRGESSCVDIANYNKAKGEEIAFENARSKVWLLLGFRLADRLASEGVYMDALMGCDFRLWNDVHDQHPTENEGIPLAVSAVYGTVAEGPTIFMKLKTTKIEKTH